MVYSNHRQSHKTVKQADIVFSCASIAFPQDKPYFNVESALATLTPVSHSCLVFYSGSYPLKTRAKSDFSTPLKKSKTKTNRNFVNPILLVLHVTVYWHGTVKECLRWWRGKLKYEDWPVTHCYSWCIEPCWKDKRVRPHTGIQKEALSITALHFFSGHVAPSVFPRTDGFCRLGGHGTTITSKRIWQHNSLTKAASTTHFLSAWHTLICKCMCVYVCACLSSICCSIFCRWEHRGNI